MQGGSNIGNTTRNNIEILDISFNTYKVIYNNLVVLGNWHSREDGKNNSVQKQTKTSRIQCK